MRDKLRYRLKGFTLAELLVVMALASVAITFSYQALMQVQKLFADYKRQNRFLNEVTDLKSRLAFEALKAEKIVEEEEGVYGIYRDSIKALLRVTDEQVLLKRQDRCDTFHVKAKVVGKNYEPMQNLQWQNKLLRELQLGIAFKEQTYLVVLGKEHSAEIKLRLETETAP